MARTRLMVMSSPAVWRERRMLSYSALPTTDSLSCTYPPPMQDQDQHAHLIHMPCRLSANAGVQVKVQVPLAGSTPGWSALPASPCGCPQNPATPGRRGRGRDRRHRGFARQHEGRRTPSPAGRPAMQIVQFRHDHSLLNTVYTVHNRGRSLDRQPTRRRPSLPDSPSRATPFA